MNSWRAISQKTKKAFKNSKSESIQNYQSCGVYFGQNQI